ncbi:MAG TPA: SpvB/TcaC N-terminal domain-containing protein, partial [Candidatus Saccharimonadales bacterium]|nr:SpvB/TcaC N-terminal domain-containing protein [Candidatus Saccharimonadales bacterium]
MQRGDARAARVPPLAAPPMFTRLRLVSRRARGSAAFGLLLSVLLSLAAPAADKNGASPNAITLPSGPGSIEGLGESFQPALNSGTMRYSIGLQLPPGTAGHTPALQFTYEGGQGNGPLGYGWSLPLACVQRQTDKGLPRYVDGPNGLDDDHDGVVDEADELDVFINDAKEELVPLANGDYFCKNEQEFIRYRRLSDHWEGVLPNGTRMEFGLTEAGRISDGTTNRVFKWLLERETDTHGNVILFSWQSFPGTTNTHQRYLQEIRYGPGAPPWNCFHFAAFTYEDRADWFEDCRSGFVVRTGKRLAAVTVGTQGATPPGHAVGDFNQDGSPDVLNRRYQLSYLDEDPGQPIWSLLSSITQVGADGVSTLPPARFGYSVCHPPATVALAGEGMGGTNEPPFVMDNANV